MDLKLIVSTSNFPVENTMMTARNATTALAGNSSSKILSEGIWIQADGSLTGILTVTVLLIISLFIIWGNMTVIAAKIKQPQLLVGTRTTTFFLINLAVTDLMVGIFQPVNLLVLLLMSSEEFYTNYWACYLGLGLQSVFVGASTQFVCLTTFDRYLYIRRPFWHLRMFTPGKAYLLTAFFWTLIAVFGLLPAAGWNSWDSEVGCTSTDIFSKVYLMVTFGTDGMLLIAVMLMNILIYKTARAQREKISAEQRIMGSTGRCTATATAAVSAGWQGRSSHSYDHCCLCCM